MSKSKFSLEPEHQQCPKCKDGTLLELPSMNKKMCTNGKCAAVYNWFLKDGQKSVTIKNLVGGRD